MLNIYMCVRARACVRACVHICTDSIVILDFVCKFTSVYRTQKYVQTGARTFTSAHAALYHIILVHSVCRLYWYRW